jgi:hypothetical protein
MAGRERATGVVIERQQQLNEMNGVLLVLARLLA